MSTGSGRRICAGARASPYSYPSYSYALRKGISSVQALYEPETQLSMARAAAISAAYAAFLESLNRSYENKWTWLTVVAGTALTGGCVAWRFVGPLPTLNGRPLLWWAWQQVFLHFCATGAPIIAWQLWADQRDQREAMKQIWVDDDAT